MSVEKAKTFPDFATKAEVNGTEWYSIPCRIHMHTYSGLIHTPVSAVYLMDGWSPLDGSTCLCGVYLMDEWSPLDGSTCLCGVYLMDEWSPLDGSTRLCGVY